MTPRARTQYRPPAALDVALKACQPATRAPLRCPRSNRVINERYGLGRDQSQFIVYRARTPKPDKQERKGHGHKPVAFFTSLEAALMWIVMRQAHFDDEPTIDTNILDAFQRYCHHMDQTKADIRALADRLETALPSDAQYRSLTMGGVRGIAN